MEQRSLTSILIALLLAASACDDPAPIVLGKLQARIPDAGRPREHDEAAEHEAAEHAREEAVDDE